MTGGTADGKRPSPAAVAALLIGGAALLKLLWRASVPMTRDAVHFVLAVDDFSVARMQPHFPGYPLYVLAGRALSPLFGAPGALSWLSAASGALLPAALLLWRSPESRAGAPWAGALFLAFSPVLWLCAGEIGSDAPGLLVGVGGLLLLLRGHPTAAGLLLGALAGVRASYLFLWIPALAAGGGGQGGTARLRLALGIAAGASAALLSLLILSGGSGLAGPARFFLHGHLLEWGTPFRGGGGAAEIAGRILAGTGSAFRFAPPFHPAGWIHLAACLALLPALFRGAPPASRRLWAAYLFAFFAWTLLFQNPSNLRHFLPLEFAAAAGAANLWEGTSPGVRRRALAAAFGAAALLFLLLARERADGASPGYRIAAALAGHRPAGEGLVYLGGDSARVVAYHLPGARVVAARSFDDALFRVRGMWEPPGEVWVSGELFPKDFPPGVRKVYEGSGWRGLSRAPFALGRLAPDRQVPEDRR